MEHKLRGMIEKLVDDYLKSEAIQPIITLVKDLDVLLTNEEEVVFGYVLGILDSGFSGIVFASAQRIPTRKERDEFYEILKRRCLEINEVIQIEYMK